MIAKLIELGGSQIGEVTGPNPLPPASVQSFLKNNDQPQFPAVVITDHKAGFTNKYIWF